MYWILVCALSRLNTTSDQPENKNTMTEQEILEKIAHLKTTLTGNIFEDGETMQEIYDLKKTLRPEIETNPELDDFDDEGCLYCGS
jgi:hypothetical protein